MMNRKLCCFCGSSENITRDHIPPKNLFLKPLPTNLITIPSCKSCNEDTSLDDEYFRICVSTQGYNDVVGKKIWDEKVVDSSFRRSKKLRNEIKESQMKINVKTKGGLYLGNLDALTYDSKRINNILIKICKGLIYFDSPDIDLMKISVNVIGLTKKDKKLEDIVNKIKSKSIGNNNEFIYWSSISSDDRYTSFWIFMFYNNTIFSVSTEPK